MNSKRNHFWKFHYKFIIGLILLCLIILFCIYLYHRIQLENEKTQRQPIGEIIHMKNKKMSVYRSGNGPKTLVFLSGSGTCSPILDFKSLTSLLDKEYQVVVIEKFGYGFSDNIDGKRDVATILEESRLALNKLNIKPPYVLIPHSMSGIQALYWAQQYPHEVSHIVGLDMSTPMAYEALDINPLFMKLLNLSARSGIIRFVPRVSESDAILHGTLTSHEKEIYRALFYEKTMNHTMVQELEDIKQSAQLVNEKPLPNIPFLLLVSNGQGTSFSLEKWHQLQMDFKQQLKVAKMVKWPVSHYLHDYKYQEIVDEIRLFLKYH